MESTAFELGFLVHPEQGAHPGVVMIHDVWGLADHTRALAQRLAEAGYAVLAVDLYRREASVEISDPGVWMRGLSDVQVVADLQLARDFLAGHSAVGGRAVGITGFCMGGLYVLLAAAGVRDLGAAVSYYGLLSYEHGLLAPQEGGSRDPTRKPRSPLEAASSVACPVLGLFGEDDSFVPVDDVRALGRALAASGQDHEVKIYSGAGHAFMNDTRPEMYRPEVAGDAWERMLGWFALHLEADGARQNQSQRT